MSATLSDKNDLYFYGDSEYGVELFDHVEVRIDGYTHEGQVTAIHQHNEVTVRYRDELDFTRRTGEPKRKRARVQVSAIDLLRRDG